ncbi:MAG: hypothetical protein HY270_15695 [Deltaproteobacteria bacterium]|nr:hypothetical protein [Deltaproteobacteria bacterium]
MRTAGAVRWRLRRYACGLLAALPLAASWLPPLYATTLPRVGDIDSVVGSGVGDGRPASDAIVDPRGLSIRPVGGNVILYIADGSNNRIRTVDGSTGIIATVAGTGHVGYSGDNGPATLADLRFPTDVLSDTVGNVYIADSDNNRVRRINTNGTITTYAGTGVAGSSGDGGIATAATLSAPRGLAFDAQGNLYVAEFSGNRIRRIAANGIITTVAGSGTWGNLGDGGAANQAQLANPTGIAIDPRGSLYIADYNNSKIRVVDTTGIITTIAGDGFQGFVGDGGPAVASRLKLPYRVVFDPSGNLLILDNGNNRVRRIQAVSGIVSGAGIITTVAGNGANGSTGDGGAATAASLWYLNGLAVGSSGLIYLGVTINQIPSLDNRVRVVNSGTIQSYVGGKNGDGGPAVEAMIDPHGVDSGGSAAPTDLYIADANNSRIRYVNGNSGIISTVAGNGTGGFSGDGGLATNAAIHSPFDVARDSSGNLWIADTLNNRVRKVLPSGVITTVAGTGSYGYGGDGGSATSASLALPYAVAVDAGGTTLYIADFANNRIRKVVGGTITTVAGTGTYGYAGDGGPATSAKLASPSDIGLAPDGTLYIADFGNNLIRHVRADGIIERVAGTGQGGFSGDGGAATAAKLYQPSTISLDQAGNLYIGDSQNKRVRRVDAATGIIVTIAGTGLGGTEGDDGPAMQANLYRPTGLEVAPNGELYIAQSDSTRVRVVTLDSSSSPPNNFNLSGTLSYFGNNAGVDAAAVTISASSQGTQSTQSDVAGNFTISGVPGNTWTLTPRKDGGGNGAITALDATIALEASVGLLGLSPAQVLACDANGSGTISGIDASLILQYRVGLIPKLPVAQACSSDWIFSPNPATAPNQSLTQPIFSGGNCQLGSISYNPLASSAALQNLTGIFLGDCNGSWQSGVGAAATSTGAVHVGRLRRQGAALWVPLMVMGTTTFNSVEITLRYDPSALASPTFRSSETLSGALMEINREIPGRVSIAAASPFPLPAGRIAWLRFASNGHISRDAVRIVHAIVESN